MAFALPFSKSELPKKLFINNEYVDSKNDAKLEIHNPCDSSLVANDIPLANAEDVDLAVAGAKKAFKSWRNTPAKLRRDLMLKLADLIDANTDALTQLGRLNLGYPKATFSPVDMGLVTEGLRYFAGWTDKFPGESYPQEDGFLKVVRNEPLGVCAAIMPWNGPLGGVGIKAGPALATGNTIILKPSEKTPLAALALGSLIKEAGFPPGVIQILSGDGSTGALLAKHMDIAKVSFTGSTSTGRLIQEMAAKSNLKRVTLELGGKSPAIVFDDADLENAITWCVNMITGNTGQVCTAPSRVYVQKGIYQRFVEGYKAAMEEKAQKVGDPDDAATMIGPLVDKIQYERVSGFVERAKKDGKLLTGGSRIGEKGYFVEPTVFVDVGDNAEITRDEVFGPVSVLSSFETEEEVVEKANNTYYGLAAGIFTENINRAFRLASDIDAGLVGINAVSIGFLNAPFGGMKMSGLGRENALIGLQMYTEKKTIFINMTR